MQIHNKFVVPIPPAEAWSFLMDIPSTIACFPGAELIDQSDDGRYRGRVTVRLGPLAMVFNGTVRVEDRDDAAHSGTVKAAWAEAKGRGNANTVTRFRIGPSGAGAEAVLDTDIQLAGQVAQYGRASGMIADISAQLIAQFADNLRARLKGVAPEHKELSALELASRVLLNKLKS